jgi:hypothetical protein
MKHIVILLSVLLIATQSFADACTQALMPAFTASQAQSLCTKLGTAYSSDLNFASGKTIALQEATAASACSGSLTFNGTTAVVTSTTCARTGARIFLTPTSDPTGSTAAYCWISAISNGVSFTVDCDQANDGTANWIIVKEAN